MTALERLLTQQLRKLAEQHAEQLERLANAQQQQAEQLEQLAKRVLELTELCQQ